MRYRVKSPRLLLALGAAALLCSCGDDPRPVRHGLSTKSVESRPTGAAIDVGFAVPDGAIYLAEISMRTDFWQRSNETGKPVEKQASAKAVLEIEQTFAVPGGGRAPRSTIRMRYTSVDGPRMESFLEREPVTGSLQHEANGRARPASLRLEGGKPEEQTEALDRIGGLLFAGFAGSPAWLPDRAVRVGEAWRVEGFIRPRGMDNAIQHARKLGLSAPRPTLEGTIRVAAAREVDGTPVLELVIEALIEMNGAYRKDEHEGTMAYGNKVAGSALIAVGTGLPLSFDVTESISTEIRAGNSRTEQRATAHVIGKVRVK